MKTLIVFSVLMLTSTLACATRGPAAERPPMGTGDSGGGNTYLGRPLESYIVKPSDLPGGALAVEKIRLITNRGDTWSLRQLFNYHLHKKVWYMVPGPLKKLPEQMIGSAVPSEQAALQGFESVWLDRDLFLAMSAEDQARLILHEAVMGVRILKLGSNFDNCLAMEVEAGSCLRDSTVRRGSLEDLTPTDYNEVRRMATTLMALREPVPFNEAMTLFRTAGFGTPWRLFDSYSTGRMKAEAFADLLNESFLTQEWPAYQFTSEDLLRQYPGLGDRRTFPIGTLTWKSMGACSFDRFSARPDGGFSTAASWLDGAGGSRARSLELYPDAIDWDGESHRTTTMVSYGERLTRVQFNTLKNVMSAPQGTRFLRVEIYVRSGVVRRIDVEDRVATGSSSGSAYAGKGGVNFTCAVAPQIKIEN